MSDNVIDLESYRVPNWVRLGDYNEMKPLTHNPDYTRIGVFKLENTRVVYLIYGIAKAGGHEVLKAYYMERNEGAGTNEGTSFLPHNKTNSWDADEIPKKWQADFDGLKAYAKKNMITGESIKYL
jgi:hypothetical protein